MQRGYRLGQTFFLMQKGVFSEIPARIGLKKAHRARIQGQGAIRYTLRIDEGSKTHLEPCRLERYATREAEISQRQRVEKKREQTTEVYGSRVWRVAQGKGRGSTFNYTLPQNRAAVHHD